MAINKIQFKCTFCSISGCSNRQSHRVEYSREYYKNKKFNIKIPEITITKKKIKLDFS